MFDWVLVKHSLNKTKILSGTLSLYPITDSKYIKSDAPNIEGIKLNLYLCSISRLEQVLAIKTFDKCTVFMYHRNIQKQIIALQIK
jgi:hypothetical protein